jgi:hypothetical protein
MIQIFCNFSGIAEVVGLRKPLLSQQQSDEWHRSVNWYALTLDLIRVDCIPNQLQEIHAILAQNEHFHHAQLAYVVDRFANKVGRFTLRQRAYTSQWTVKGDEIAHSGVVVALDICSDQ